MPAIWTEDDTIGRSLANSLGGAIGRGPAMYKLGIETQALLDQRQAADDYIRQQTKRLQAAQAPSVPFSQMPLSPEGIPWEGPPSPPTPEESGKFNLNRDAAISTMTLGARNPANMIAIHKGTAAGQALNDLSMYGVPTNPQELLRQDVQLRGHYPDVALTPKDQFTQAKIDERWANLQSIAQTRDLTNVEQREAQILAGYKNKSKTSVSAQGVTTQDEYNWSGPEQTLLRKAGVLTGQPPAVGQQQPLPNVQQAAPPSGPGAAVTVPTATPATPPQAAAPQATGPQTRNIPLPSGQQISVTPLPGRAPTAEQARAVASVERARAARGRLEGVIGVDPATGKIDPKNFYVPDFLPGAIASQSGGNQFGMKAAQLMESMWTQRGDKPGVNEFYTYGRQWVEPVLRYATGAASPPPEAVNYFSQFIPSSIDSPALVQDKIETMRGWEVAIAKSQSVEEGLKLMEQTLAHNPVAMKSVEQARTIATNNGTLGKTYEQVAAEEAALQAKATGTTPPAIASQAGTPAAGPAAAPRTTNYEALDRLLGLR